MSFATKNTARLAEVGYGLNFALALSIVPKTALAFGLPKSALALERRFKVKLALIPKNMITVSFFALPFANYS